MGRPARRRPLREDGPQRHRVRRHAADLRSLLHAASRRSACRTTSCTTSSTTGTAASCDSYLIEITRDIFSVKDTETGELPGRQDPRHGRRKGHRQVDEPARARPGRAQHAGDRSRVCPLPVGDEGRPRPREQSARRARRPSTTGDRKKFIEAVRHALYASKICSYAQGFVQIAGRGQGARADANEGTGTGPIANLRTDDVSHSTITSPKYATIGVMSITPSGGTTRRSGRSIQSVAPKLHDSQRVCASRGSHDARRAR